MMENKNEVFGKRLKLLRNKTGKNQQDIADAIGISRARYSHYENNHVEPDMSLIRQLSDLYNVSTDYLLGRTEDPEPFHQGDEFNPMQEINKLLKKYNIDQSGFFDIEKWKHVGPEEIKQLESYFEFIVHEAEKKESEEKDSKKSP